MADDHYLTGTFKVMRVRGNLLHGNELGIFQLTNSKFPGLPNIQQQGGMIPEMFSQLRRAEMAQLFSLVCLKGDYR